MTKKISLGRSTASSRDLSQFLSDGPWRGYPFPCKNVLIILTEFWLGVAGRSMQHGQTPQNRCLPFSKVAKYLTMMLAIYLAKEVAAILRAVLTHDTKKLYDEGTVHLLCSNYWIQPIYQELLHSSSRYNATRTRERNRPSSGLARVAAHPRPPKKRRPSASGTRFCDWIGGIAGPTPSIEGGLKSTLSPPLSPPLSPLKVLALDLKA